MVDFAVSGLPMYGQATLRAIFSAPADIAIGEMVVGRSSVIGMTQYGVQSGFRTTA